MGVQWVGGVSEQQVLHNHLLGRVWTIGSLGLSPGLLSALPFPTDPGLSLPLARPRHPLLQPLSLRQHPLACSGCELSAVWAGSVQRFLGLGRNT